jgi:hypothetical protein
MRAGAPSNGASFGPGLELAEMSSASLSSSGRSDWLSMRADAVARATPTCGADLPFGLRAWLCWLTDRAASEGGALDVGSGLGKGRSLTTGTIGRRRESESGSAALDRPPSDMVDGRRSRKDARDGVRPFSRLLPMAGPDG